MNNTYYQDELRYLREVGPDFARANPEIARFLSDRGSDPDVERVLEGVAFLCGRIRQKLDDELPELTHGMMGLLWPHYLRPIPSMSILELLPEIEGMQGPMEVAAGAEFASMPVDGTRCRYRSSWPVTLRPWGLVDVALETAAAQPVRLRLRFQTAPKVTLEALDLRRLRLHLAGEPRTASLLYWLLAAHVEHVTVSDAVNRPNRPEELLPADRVAAAGLTRDEAVLPFPARSFPGYRLLQEYFTFKDRFLFIDVLGIDAACERLGLENTLELTFTFNRRPDSLPLVSRDNVRLHCVPIINLFGQPADPIRLRHDVVRHLVQPSRSNIADRRHAEIHSIDRVVGVTRAEAMETREYKPFYSFAHLKTLDPRSASYYQTHLEPNVVNSDTRFGTDTFISFTSGVRAGEFPQEETISIEMTCSNRDLPQALRAGDINQPTDSAPAGVRFRNLTKPTTPVAPPLGPGLQWRLISHLSLNYVSLLDVEHFRELLRVYDFQSEHDVQVALAQQRLLEGIVSLRSEFKERMVRGAPIRGAQVSLELNEDHFAGPGDAYLFSMILDRFFALYVTMNAFSQLNVRLTRSGLVYSFPPRWGEQITPVETRSTDGRGD